MILLVSLYDLLVNLVVLAVGALVREFPVLKPREKKMNHKLKIMILLIMIVSGEVFATSWGEPTVICKDGSAYVHDVTFDTGCVYPSTAYFKTLHLRGNSPNSGEINIEMGYTSSIKNPHCNNPRGRPHFFEISLPVDHGNWEVSIVGGKKFQLTLLSECMVQTL